ncbi:unnamed protein product [Mycena citricolor]|nr:unnamed protein product [Mycena citricolor]
MVSRSTCSGQKPRRISSTKIRARGMTIFSCPVNYRRPQGAKTPEVTGSARETKEIPRAFCSSPERPGKL